MTGGGRFDFDDGGTYCGGWEDGKAHGFGVCTGPKGQGEYAGAWQHGFEISGVYMWPSGNCFEGQWMQGKRHGVGVESKGKWVYKGEWTQGFKGRYGVRQSMASGAKYEGTWTTGLQDGYGVETYADGGTYQGQWLRGMRHGYGVRQSVPYGMAAHYRPKVMRESLTSLRSENDEDFVVKDRDRKIDEGRGGFVLSAKSDEPSLRRPSLFDKQGRSSLRNSLMKGLKLKKQKSTGDIQESPRRSTGSSVRSTASNISNRSAESTQSAVSNVTQYTDSNQSFVSQDDIQDVNVTETYMGELKNDKRSGFGVSERSDGLKYEGDWYNNKKHGYGVTTHKDGSKEEGKWKNNVLISSGKKSKLFLIRSSKLRERVDNAVTAAQRAAQIALQKADIANSRMANARAKAEQAELAAKKAREDSDIARIKAKEFAPEFHQPGTDILKKKLEQQGGMADMTGITPTQNHIGKPNQRTNSLIMRRQGSAGNGSLGGLGSNKLKINITTAQQERSTANHTGYNTLPNNISSKKQPKEELLSTTTSSPMVGNHVNKQSKPWDERDGDIRPTTAFTSMMSPTSQQPRSNPIAAKLTYQQVKPPTQRLSIINSGDLDDPGSNVENGREYGSPDRFSDRHSEDRYSVDRFSDHQSVEPSSAQFSERSPSSNHPGPSLNQRLLDNQSESTGAKTSSLKRIKTLPSIVKHTRSFSTSKLSPSPSSTLNRAPAVSKDTNLSSDDEELDTFIIEDGIHKRLQAEVYSRPRPPSPTPSITSNTSYVEEKPRELPNQFSIEKSNLSASRKRGSVPDVSQCKEMHDKMQTRKAMRDFSELRREHLRRKREAEEQRRKLELVISLADIKDWCQERQLLMIVIALNISLATMFFNLLAQ